MGSTTSKRAATSLRQKQIEAKRPYLALKEKQHPRFIADVMLGRLAKWLRIAGFDVLYSNKFTDDELVAISNREERILLSRDTRLLVRKSVKDFIFLESQDVQAQIRQVFETMHVFSLSSPLSRCLTCNEGLVEAEKESVRHSVPAFVYRTQTHFRSCPKCGRIFWAGTHRSAVIRTLKGLLAQTVKNHV